MAASPRVGLTDEQSLAISTRDVSIALSAGAGCGKTHVLVERYLSHLTADGNHDAMLSRLIAITFTDRAAREMRDRVRIKVRERLQDAEQPEIADRWLALLRELETARVSTIHAFCGAFLRAHAVEARIDPRYQILEQNQSATLFSELLDDQLRELLAQRNEDLLDLIFMFGLHNIRSMIQHLVSRRHAIDFDIWRTMTADQLLDRWQHVEREQVLPLVLGSLRNEPAMRTLLAISQTVTPTSDVMRERCQQLTFLIPQLERTTDPRQTLTAIRNAALIKGGGEKKNWPDEEAYVAFRDAAADIRDAIDSLTQKVGIEHSVALPSAEAGLKLLRVAESIILAYEQKKTELGFLDFDDLLIRTRDLLRGEHGARLRKRVSSQLAMLLVDEFQDTDPLQVELVKILCGDQVAKGKLFFVGDAKQSIYRFRGADPRVFRRLRDEIPDRGRLPLTLNFRSQPAILDFVNALFCDRLGPDYEPLRPNRAALHDKPCIEFLWGTIPPEENDRPSAELLRGVESEWIARRLASMFTEGERLVLDKVTGQARAVEPRDVVLLCRALTDVRFYESALRRHGIPYYVVGGGAFYAQQEVFDLLNLLRSLDSARDEISLAGVLRSPFFSLTDETLFWLARHTEGLAASLLEAEPPAQLDDEQRQRVAFAARTMQYLRTHKDQMPIAALIEHAMSLTGYDALLLAEFLGERKLANLRKLIDQARGFDDAGIFTLADFINQLAEFVSRQPQEAPAAVQPEASQVVRVMSIHQAKGLEFPVVVVPDLARTAGGPKSNVAFDGELGPLVVARVRGEEARPCGIDVLRILEHAEDEDEEIRLFYVATTRAADYLMLSSGVKNIERPTGTWMPLLAEHFDLRTGHLLAELPPEYGEPKVRVTIDEPKSAKVERQERIDLELVAATARELASGGVAVPSTVPPIDVNRTARRIFSFSSLANEFAPLEPTDIDRTRDDDTATVNSADALDIGTLSHAVLALVDFNGMPNIAAFCQRQLDRQFAATKIETAPAVEMIERFLKSERAAALRTAKVVHRELEFVLVWPPQETKQTTKADRNDGSSGVPRLIRGFIDCLYQDQAGHWHLLDFKTNRIAPASTAQAAAAYELQMYLYAMAAEQVLGQNASSLVLHFLHTGTEHTFAWTAAARQKTMETVNQAIAGLV